MNSDTQAAAPTVSVIMATYNGARFIRQSINSILAQTFPDFELIIADDCSTDETPAILAAITDPRVVIVRNPANLGVVGSRNRCFSLARGRYIAMLDHDDLSRPTRLARQVAYMDTHPDTVLLGTAAHTLTDGRLALTNHPKVTTPLVIAWLLHVANPLMCASVMFRAAAVRDMGVFLRNDYEFADDYDFYHRIAARGVIARLDEPLTIYRLHPENTFRHHEEKMTANAVKVLAPAYEKWFGAQAEAAATLVVRHLSAARPVPDAASFALLSRAFGELTQSYISQAAGDAVAQRAIKAHAQTVWRRMLRIAARAGGVKSRDLLAARPAGFQPDLGDVGRLALGAAHIQPLQIGRLRRGQPAAAVPVAPPGRVFGTHYTPIPVDNALPPTLFVVVDTEAEFDWSRPFAHTLTNVSAMAEVERGQAVFDRYGLRPIYVIDYPVASQAQGYTPLLRILQRGGCEIGAHLHPWTTPPFEEHLTTHNSFPGNLPPELEAEKLAQLIRVIEANLGVPPRFYKAGRYGFGPSTAETLARHGIRVDLSVLPEADLRPQGGPDFREMRAAPYMIAGTTIMSLPMTRAHIGLAASPALHNLGERPALRGLRLPAFLARLGIHETITLTPEGVTAEEQIRLIESLLQRGQRHFVMHYHSPSLSPGHTPYVRNAADGRDFVARLERVCRYFFEEVGGVPGYPADLLQ